ncbi:GcrA family cell cycle regulator [Rhizobium sp. AAP43]|uniref:GcrA family cell cycle regulator n=1 Tax=Rhizobium sp. AAP43 TaxID=1523420 RepID=UPI0006B9ABF0|nr:GcrA family cell cycle regulator [Rhizobium sp. AAP43]KPF47084.1 hypothetical protein IP76_01950 [Rhizobium sp. AAP43]
MSRGANEKPWSEAEDKTAMSLWVDGKSASEIGHTLARSRNSVLGRIHRRRHADGSASTIASRIKVKLETQKPEPRRAKASSRVVTLPVVSMWALTDRDEGADVSLPHGWVKQTGYHRDLDRFAVPGAEPVRFGDVAREQCRFLLSGFLADDGRDTPCCGQPALSGKSWCADHSRLVWAKRQ